MIPSREKVPIQQTLPLVDESAPSRIPQQQLESYLWGAAILLRGTIDAGDYKQFIFPLLFYKRLCDVHDEETAAALAESGGDTDFAAFPENHRFQIPPEAHWRAIRAVAKNVGSALQAALRTIETANPEQLYGIFGDAQWTNKDRLSDALLHDLIEHFSSLNLTIANLPEDELGNGYEYLIKKFADDAGHTAAEFYTNRTVVHLMAELLQPQPGESIYDPTCGSGGMLLSAVAYLRQQGLEWRNLRLYGQERNLMTSSIARMNCFLHGIENFRIVRGDTLSNPIFVEGDRLQQFDMVLANPPYSIKQWDRAAFAADPWGRNFLGTPPQGRADYAFFQHILKSLAPETGRCAILFPHGVLFRQEEAAMRKRLIEADLVECVIGLGPNLFYNSPMEACVVVCRTAKPEGRKGKILLINAVNEVTRERAQSFLTNEHIERIAGTYRAFLDEGGFARVATSEECLEHDGNLSIPLYVKGATVNGGENGGSDESEDLAGALEAWLGAAVELRSGPLALPVMRDISQYLLNPDWDSLPLFDRSTWTRVRFGDVVQNVNETERDPTGAGLERFIGLEHLEPGSLHVRSWGGVADGTTFTRRCRPGQVLFGKRRAYQRKVAMAEFDAVVSGDIYVLAPKDNRLIPELVPFICLSERFYEHAVGTSAGSLSPRTNWSSLANFEFDLPPLEVQRRIADMLWAMDEVQRRGRAIDTQADTLRKARLLETFSEISSEYPHLRIRELGEIQLGRQRAPKYTTGLYSKPYLRVVNVLDGQLDLTDVGEMDFDERDFERYKLQPGDILITEGDITSPYNVGRAAIFRGEIEDCCFQNTLIRFQTGEQLSPEYAQFALQYALYRGVFAAVASTTTVTHLGAERFGTMKIPVPPVSKQLEVSEELAELKSFVARAKVYVETTNVLLERTINTLIGGCT